MEELLPEGVAAVGGSAKIGQSLELCGFRAEKMG